MFYRKLIATAAALVLATSVFADDNSAAPATTTDTTATQTTQVTTSETSTTQQLNLNSATAEELAKVKGLNQAKAAKIIKYRDAKGNFASVDDLKKVGFSAKQIKMLKKYLTV
jgi:comEA protein